MGATCDVFHVTYSTLTQSLGPRLAMAIASDLKFRSFCPRPPCFKTRDRLAASIFPFNSNERDVFHQTNPDINIFFTCDK